MAQGERLLEDAGLSDLEERIYVGLLSRQGLSSADIADHHRISDRRACATLRALEDKGLVSRSATRPPRFTPAAPGVAVEGLVLQRREKLDRTRLVIDRLNEQFRAGATDDPQARDLVQLIDGHDAVQQRQMQVLSSATVEVMGLGKAPLGTPTLAFVDLKLQLLRRGVRSRSVYEVAGLGDVVPPFLSRVAPEGEESRAVPTLPMRLLIVDRRVALTPLRTDRWDQWLLVTSPPLLDALVMVFEAIWERATPITVAGALDEAGSDALAGAELSADAQRVLMLMAAGLRDHAIADQLGMNLRTAQRHVTRVMDLVGARTRFEAGLLVADARLLKAPLRSERVEIRSNGRSPARGENN